MVKKGTIKNKSKLRNHNILKKTKNKKNKTNYKNKKNKKKSNKSNKKGGGKCCNTPKLDITYHPVNKPNVNNIHTLVKGYDTPNKGYQYSNLK